MNRGWTYFSPRGVTAFGVTRMYVRLGFMKIDAQQAFVAEGRTDLDAGEFEEFDDDSLHELFDGVAARGRDRVES